MEASQQTNRRRGSSCRFIVAIITIVSILPAIYFVSVGPVFAIAVNCEGMLSNRTVRKMYRPLFDIAPELTCCYLRQCGVSDVETFFVIQASKGESR